MKKLLLAILAFGGAMASSAQDTALLPPPDTTTTEQADTIHVGGMIIIKKKGQASNGDETVIISNENKRKKPSRISTNWMIFDFGFNNLNDQTNYASAETQAFAPGFTNKDQLQLKTGKSVNVNIWFFMQRLSLIKQVVNLKYGLGLELNNYHFDDEKIKLTESPTQIIINPELEHAKKNKLAADYITVPMMLNFNFTPQRKNGFGFSAGISAGCLYSARQKIKLGDDRSKFHDDFNLREWKLSYVGELNLGPVKLYGSYAWESMWEEGLNQTPYNVGIRFSQW